MGGILSAVEKAHVNYGQEHPWRRHVQVWEQLVICHNHHAEVLQYNAGKARHKKSYHATGAEAAIRLSKKMQNQVVKKNPGMGING